MLRKSLTKITSTTFQCSRRGFANKGPKKPETDWWNKPVNELKPSLLETSSNNLLKEVSVLPAISGAGLPPKVVSIVDSSASSGSSYSSKKETPCAEKKFSPCAEKKPKLNRPKKNPNNGNGYESQSSSSTTSSSNCAHHKSLVPPSCDLQKLKSYEVKSTCTSFHLQTEN